MYDKDRQLQHLGYLKNYYYEVLGSYLTPTCTGGSDT